MNAPAQGKFDLQVIKGSYFLSSLEIVPFLNELLVTGKSTEIGGYRFDINHRKGDVLTNGAY